MSDLIDTFVEGFAQFQDTFGSAQLTNGAALIQRAAGGNITGTNFKIGFTSLGSESSIKNRVYIQVPKQYWQDNSKLQILGNENLGWGGIYFPVTPTIRQDSKANWNPSALQHSNYAIYSYQNSDVGSISVSGQFPVQTQQEAFYWVATVTALRALTKMRTGNDTVPGAPPPVCRFNAYGSDIYDNVPVVIGNFSIELPSDVDYVTGFNFNGIENKVPVLSTISLTLIPVYSRREMSQFSVDGFIKGTLSRGYI
jgi:hypothetical protein